MPERYDHFNIQSRGFETSWDLTMRRLSEYSLCVGMKKVSRNILLVCFYVEMHRFPGDVTTWTADEN